MEIAEDIQFHPCIHILYVDSCEIQFCFKYVLYLIIMFSFISFRRSINYLLPRLLNFWKPDTLPRITNRYDVHAYMPQHQYLAFFVYIITVYTSLYYILKHKISNVTSYTCVMASTDLSTFSLFIRQNFITKNVQPASILRSKCSSLLRK